MNIKKIIAGVAASALAVSALATSAFASLLVSPWGDTCTANGDTITFTDAWAGGWIQFNKDENTPLLAQDEFEKYDIVVKVKVDAADLTAAADGGAIDDVLLFKMGDTSTENYAGYGVEGATEYTFVFPAKDVNTQATAGADGKIYFGCNIQNGAVKKADMTITYADAGTVKDSDNAPEAAAPAATEGGDKGTPDTGVEGVAVVAALAVLAGGAIVVAKKRK